MTPSHTLAPDTVTGDREVTPAERRYWDEARETCDPADRDRRILERMQQQLRYVYEELPFYRRHYDRAGFRPEHVTSLADFTAKVPIITKKMLVEDQREHPPFGSYTKDFGVGGIARVHGSSGTSGTPTMYAVSRRDWDRAADVHAMAQWCAGVRPDDIVQIGFPFGLFFGGWGVLQGVERIGATVFPLGVTDSEKHIEMIGTLGSTVFSATPSYCIHLLSVAERMGVDLRASPVRHVLVGGEPGGSLPGTRRIIEEGWGATVADAGSTSEMYPFQTSVGCEAGTGTHLITDEVYTEVVDRDDPNAAIPTGERGAVVYTHLWRESQPMIRFAPGDETYLDDAPCPCGRTYPRMPEGVLGRLDDMLVIRGANIYPSAVETALRDIPELGPEFRIHVTTQGALDEIAVHAEVSAATDDAWHAAGPDRHGDERAALVERAEAVLRHRLGIRVPFEVLAPGTLEPTTFKARRVIDTRGVRW
ncbi:phenylacetate--CoA ligase family protein [Gordonia jinghuaiqii]|uniref:Phenylacetate--CoA ligase family protein n=1 Tax=Gordonia jinghuaiqii TaxID=2758710 RepID=A0A7D7LV63_9ACTN|nr:phenylacetate--CoA ligase family protein [Gordonia jinghuaiqii]MCR5979937.1 phenylacetate--CoA ligase family protein [Gordonia jinghuaiqii]QMT03137.1 phenylacetate--CoA ligase family protein [Gordonia jinghuaiqii]